MNANNLLDLIKTGEGYTIELKESINSSLGKEICSFANAQGGKIIIGVEDKTNIVKGFKLTNKDKSKIQDIVRNIDPSFNVQIEQIQNIVIIYVPEGKNKPYTVNGHFYIRQGANSQQLNRNEIRSFFQKENLMHFEKQTTDFNKSDFSNKLLTNFKKKANLTISKESILNNLNLTTNDKLNNAGLLFFSKEIKKYHPTAIILCFLYSDEEQVDIIDSKEFSQDIITNLEETYKYIISKLNNAIILDGSLQHKRHLELPREAMREALINAIVHKDYLFPSYIQINISPDKVEIINPGKLLFPKTEFGRTSSYRNPIMADLMQRLGETERAGSGIKRIKKYCKEESIKLKFETNEIFRTIFYRDQTKPDKTRQNQAKTKPKPSQKLTKEERKNLIIKEISNNCFSNRNFAKKIGISRSTVESDLNELKEENKTIFVGFKRAGHWEIIQNG